MIRIRKEILQWNFDKKIKVLVSLLLVGTSLLVLAVSTLSSVHTVSEQSRTLLQEQNRAVAAGLESSLNNYKALAYSITMSEPIQQYLGSATPSPSEANALRGLLTSTLNMSSSLNFVAVIDKEGQFFYKGNESMAGVRFTENWRQDYNNCPYVVGTSMRLNFSNRYYGGSRFTLSLYFPVYDTNHIGQERGLLCMNFSDKSLEQVMRYQDKSMHSGVALVDINGAPVVASANLATTSIDPTGLMLASSSFQRQGRTFFHQKIKNWPFYVVSSIADSELYASGRKTVLFLLLVVAGVLVVSLFAISRSIRMLYRPLEKTVCKMEAVAQGAIRTRMNEDHMGADFKKLACGFNTMMDRISELMEQIKEEQHQMEQIRFLALQSQIKPHFLYNTLECVHWQAVVDGNEKISTMVKALAKYYRICLSGGMDLIPLSEELEHVRSYLVIQNMRYGDIIDSKLEVSGALGQVQIPKITLQPLVENSIYHGIKIKEGKCGMVAISCSTEQGDVLLTLSDTGTGMPEEKIAQLNCSLMYADASVGYGVSNVHRRIQLLYGLRYGLQYSSNRAGGISVTIRLPRQAADDEKELHRD